MNSLDRECERMIPKLGLNQLGADQIPKKSIKMKMKTKIYNFIVMFG